MYMNIISNVDFFLYKIAYKLGLKLQFYSYEQLILRYVRRDTKRLRPAVYEYPREIEQSKRAWVFWAQGQESMPPIIRKCYESIEKNCGDYLLTFITLQNIDQFVDVPDYIRSKVESGNITLTHFSDFLRVSLLNKWGGFWVDVTLFLSKPLLVTDRFFTIKQPYDEKNVSRCQWTGYLWYMPKGHPLAHFLTDYLTLYWQKHDKIIEYLLIDYAIRVFYEKNKIFASEIDSLQYSNPYLYLFQSDECEKAFSRDRWQQICENTSFFKTTWKKQFNEVAENKVSFYGKLLEGSKELFLEF